MTRHSLRKLLGIVGLVALTTSALGAAGFAPSAGSATAATSAPLSTTSGTLWATHARQPGSHTPNVYPPDRCLVVTLSSADAVNSNEVAPKGSVYNNCGFTVTSGRIDLYAYTQCPGTVAQNTEDYTNMSTLYVHSTVSFQGQLAGYCEVCQNGVPVLWPPFSIVTQIDASGYGPNHITVEDTDTAEKITSLQNSPAYSFPCP